MYCIFLQGKRCKDIKLFPRDKDEKTTALCYSWYGDDMNTKSEWTDENCKKD